MRHLLSAVGSSRHLARRIAVLLLLFVLGAAALPAVQAQGINMYIFLFGGGGSVQEDSRHPVRFSVNRASLGAGYGHEAHFKLCVDGDATVDVDYYVSSSDVVRLTPNGSCFNEKFTSGRTRIYYAIWPIDDFVHEGNERVIVTMSEDGGNPFPGGYYFPSRYGSTTFRFIDNE